MAKKALNQSFRTTADIPVSDRMVGQVLGQEKGVSIIKKAAEQKRNVLLIGDPGTGKSMLAQAMAELLPVEQLQDILVYPNEMDKNNPHVSVIRAGEGRKIVNAAKKKKFEAGVNDLKPIANVSFLMAIIYAISISLALYFKWFSDIILAAFIIVGGVFMMMLLVAGSMAQGLRGLRPGGMEEDTTPKLLVDNADKKMAPFVDATGARAGALLGDVRHDPYQSGGLGTPAHFRVEPGFIHRANRGVLFIDEVATLSPKSQQELLTAMQEKKYSITGQSEMSSGAMVRSDPVPCDFVLVASGNMFDLQKMHPALRSRIRGYGYEVFLNKDMPDNAVNRQKIVQFVAQEVKKDGKIPHFTRAAVEEIIFEARRRAGRKNSLTLHLRDLGGLVRAAGDIARVEHAKVTDRDHVMKAKELARTLEQQMADKQIAFKKDYDVFVTHGVSVGRVNGLAVMGDGALVAGGMLLPIEARISPAQSKSAGKTIATGKLGEIAQEAVQNVLAIVKQYKGKDITEKDVHIQFLQTYEGVEGDSASVSVATAVVSAMEGIPVKQGVAMTGSLSVNGEVLPVGGVSSKIEAAAASGVKTVVIPFANKDDVVLGPEIMKKIEIHTAKDLCDVLRFALKEGKPKDVLVKEIRKIIRG